MFTLKKNNLYTTLVCYTLVFCFWSATIPTKAQVDTEFWFAAPDVDANHGDSPIFLHISTYSEAAQVRITQPANLNFSPITTLIPANDTRSIELTSRKSIIENQPANSILNYGIYITADESITVYYEVASEVNPEIFPLKGRNALGTFFAAPSQDDFQNIDGHEVLDIVATENNTIVTITPTTTLFGRPANIPFQITLQKGQSYAARALSRDLGVSLRGTTIQSTKPIAVTMSDDSILLDNGWDLIGDQMIPANLTGKTYIATRGFSGNGERVYILALEDDTQISVNGNLVVNLNALQQYKSSVLGSSMFIESNKNVYVLHLSGHPSELGSALLPHLDCTGSSQMGFVRTSPDAFALILLTKKGNEGNFNINGNTTLVTQADFVDVPSTNGDWVVMQKEFTTAQLPVGRANLISNNTGLFHLGVLNNLGASSVYGYFSAFSSLNLGPDQRACIGDFVELKAGAGANSYLWSDGSTEPNLSVNQSGEYWVKITRGDCILYDTLQINFKPIPQPMLTNLSPQYCLNNAMVNLTANPAGGVFTIDGVATNVLDPQTLAVGLHTVSYTYTDEFECQGTVSSTFEIIAPPANLALTNLAEAYCIGDDNIPLTAQPLGGRFEVNGQNNSFFSPADLGVGQHEVSYFYTDNLGCTYQVSQSVNVVDFPLPVIPSQDTLFVCPPNVRGLILEASEAATYRWSTGEIGSLIEVREPGVYEVIMDNGYGCETAARFETFGRCTPEFYLPEAFSPNQDGLNDVLEIFGGDFARLQLTIYNRWGEIIYQTFSQELPWDGTLNGKAAPTGTYLWKVSYVHPFYPTQRFEQKGKVVLMR